MRPRKFCIIGGTGSLGTELVRQLSVDKNNEITVFSRCELKQQQMKVQFPSVRYILGDIRNFQTIREALIEQDTVFHVAALKHIDKLQENPEESVYTNILGTINVANACIDNWVSHCVFCSTDKACLAINTYGKSKGIAEDILFAKNVRQRTTKFSVFRWGNVAASRGSVIPIFINDLKLKREINITDTRMTRFWIHIEDAATFMLEKYRQALPNNVAIPMMKAATVERVAACIAEIMRVKEFKINYTGIRAGEKLHETIYSSHDHCVRSDTAEQFTDKELKIFLEPIVRMYK